MQVLQEELKNCFLLHSSQPHPPTKKKKKSKLMLIFFFFSLWDLQEYWCKRLHPKNVCEKVFRQPPLRESLKKGKLRKQDHATTKQKTALLHAADSIGKKIQYDCPGFLPNKRQVI